MLNFTAILTDLKAAIAARAARDRTLTVLLVALWGRIARITTRLERLVALWRAGKLPKPRAPRAAVARSDALRHAPKTTFPTTPGWLRRKLGYEVGAYGLQLRHLLTDAECVAFLAAVPQAGRILRPLLRMLSSDPLPAVISAVKRVVPTAAPVLDKVGSVVSPESHFFST